MTTTPVLELLGIEKRFGSVEALSGADFVLGRGEVHGLLGENGAGKSTLMHIAFGLVRPDHGTIRVGGRQVSLSSPAAAKAFGIGMVHQHFTSISSLTVRENLWLAAGRHGDPAGDPPAPTGQSALERLRVRLWDGLSPNTLVEDLPVSAKQRLELLQAVATGAHVLLLDEPTAVLTPAEVASLTVLLRDFAAGGGSVVFITHKLNEVLEVVDRVTVLRRGRVTWHGPVKGQTVATLAEAMVGVAADGDGRPQVKRDPGGPTRIRVGALEVRGGEIVGVAAVEGNGQRQLLRSLAGLAPRVAGTTVDEPIAFLPEDRTVEGLVPSLSLTENMVLGLPSDPRWRRVGRIDWKAARRRTEAIIGEYGIRTSGPDAPVRTMSGGNQQKLVFARAVEARPSVVVAENPTRGLDVLATADIHRRLRALAADGAAVVVYSTDLDEVLELADRVVVLYRGAMIMPDPAATRDQIGALMLGGAS